MNAVELILEAVKGAEIINIETCTIPTLRGGKSNPQQGKIRKFNKSSVMVFSNTNSNGYDNMVRRRLEQEGKNPDLFVLGKRSWGVRQPDSPFIVHNDQLYLEVIFMKKAGETIFQDDEGNVLERHEIQGLPSDDDVDSESQGGLSGKVIIRTFKLESICAITARGKHYILTSR